VKKSALVIIVLVLVVTTILLAAAPSQIIKSRLEIKNKSHQKVMISLQGSGNFFYLVIDPLTEKIFTLPPQMYSHTTWACGRSTSGSLNMNTNVRLVFTRCGDFAKSKGEPTQEKIHINDSPGETIHWRYFNFE
jgi:hypothetical protein